MRHGITKSNKEKRYVGWGDVELSSLGIEQAERVAERFSSLPLKGLYSSDLLRTVKTAEPIGREHGISPVRTPLLREINFGKWEGLTHSEIARYFEEEQRNWIKDPFHRAPVEGETLIEVCQRMKRFLREISSQENDGAVVVVTHGGAIRSILHHYLNLKPQQLWDLKVDNASVSLMRKKEDAFKVVCVNSMEHLESLGEDETA